MAVYAIGDVQGCYDALRRLLEHLRFDPASDRLWLVGDLVNRGPASREVLRCVRGLGAAAQTVLGNHDLHLLAVAAGLKRLRRKDTLRPLLEAPDSDELLHWLRHRPLLHHDPELGHVLVHAGISPQWDLATARRCARELEAVLRGPGCNEFLRVMYGDEPARWDPALSGMARLRYIVNAFTRMRYVDSAMRLDLDAKDPPGRQPRHLLPWFRHPHRLPIPARIVFGHWSALGYLYENNVLALDTGCVWGGRLTAVRLDAHIPQPSAIPCTACA